MAQLCGGMSQMRQADEDEIALFNSLQASIAENAEMEISEFEVLGCASQVVAGTNFWVKIRTNNGIIHVKIFRPLPHTQQPA